MRHVVRAATINEPTTCWIHASEASGNKQVIFFLLNYCFCLFLFLLLPYFANYCFMSKLVTLGTLSIRSSPTSKWRMTLLSIMLARWIGFLLISILSFSYTWSTYFIIIFMLGCQCSFNCLFLPYQSSLLLFLQGI